MYYGKTKVYFDGSHYIAIPHTERNIRKRPPVPEEIIEVETVAKSEDDCKNEELENLQKNSENIEKNIEKTEKIAKKLKNISKKEFFNELYAKYIDLPKRERKKIIIEEMSPYFTNRDLCVIYVEKNFERKNRNLICRRVRMCRKAYLANFNYFCTFTYDDKKHNEQSFRKGIKTYLRNLCYRKGWKYMGVWERAPKTNRLHFHGLFNIPNNTIPGELIKVRDYDTISHKMQDSVQSSYFNDKFGRSDFKDVVNKEQRLTSAITYLMKYIEKTGEKIVYSKGLYQYFMSDIMEEDVVSTIGQEDKKLLLFDDFNCWEDGCLIGKVNDETISQLEKCN